jgi:hypothetical protein
MDFLFGKKQAKGERRAFMLESAVRAPKGQTKTNKRVSVDVIHPVDGMIVQAATPSAAAKKMVSRICGKKHRDPRAGKVISRKPKQGTCTTKRPVEVKLVEVKTTEGGVPLTHKGEPVTEQWKSGKDKMYAYAGTYKSDKKVVIHDGKKITYGSVPHVKTLRK